MYYKDLQNTNKNKKYLLEYLVGFIVTFVSLCFSIHLFSTLMFVAIIFCLVLLVFIVRLLRKEPVIFHKFDFLWIIFLLMVLISKNKQYSWTEVFFVIAGITLMFLFRNNSKCYTGIIHAIVCFSLLNIAANILSLVSNSLFSSLISALKITNFEAHESGSFTGLASGTSRNASLIAVGLSAFFSLMFVHKKRSFFVLFVLCGLSALFILATGKLGHTLSIYLALLIFVYSSGKTRQKRIKALFFFIILSVLLVISVFILFPSSRYILIHTLEKSGGQDISSGRLKIWATAINLFKDNPIFGIGYGSFTVFSSKSLSATYAGVHNDYIQWLCELGLFGFTINMILAVVSLTKTVILFRKYISNPYEKRNFIFVCWSFFFQLFFLFYSFTGIPHYSYDLCTIYYLACGVPFCVDYGEKKSHQSQEYEFDLAFNKTSNYARTSLN